MLRSAQHDMLCSYYRPLQIFLKESFRKAGEKYFTYYPRQWRQGATKAVEARKLENLCYT
jgi:hypothetical protein